MVTMSLRPSYSRRAIAALSASLVLSGCATSSKDITATYVSPMQYQPYDCRQLQLEAQRIQVRVVELGGRLDQAASNDKTIAGVGMILFWPALFALGGTKQQESEYARLRGEYDAVQQAAIQKKCDGVSASAAAAPASAASTASAASAAAN